MSESQTPAGGGQAAPRPVAGARPVSRPRPIDDIHLDELLDFVVEKNASDLHLSVDLPPVVRIDGDSYRAKEAGERDAMRKAERAAKAPASRARKAAR